MARTTKIIGALLLVLLFIIAVTDSPSTMESPDEAVGSWEYSRGAYTSCMDLLPDGTYKQIIRKGKVVELKSESKWIFEENYMGRVFNFENFVELTYRGEIVKHTGFMFIIPIRPLLSPYLRLEVDSEEFVYFEKRLADCEKTEISVPL